MSIRMVQRILLLCALCAYIVFPASVLRAQEDNPLDFADKLQRVGLEIGFSSVWQAGIYGAGCGVFDKGAGLNLYIAAAYDREFADMFRFEGLVGYQGKTVQSSFNSRENIGVSTTSGPVNAEVDFENVGTASFSYVFAQPSIKFYPFTGVYVGAGASANLLMSASTQYTKNILSRTVNLNELGLSEVFYSTDQSSDPYSMVFPEEDAEGAAPVTFDGVFFIGAEFRVGKSYATPLDTKPRKRFALGPRLQYSMPFVAALTDDPYQLKLHGLQFLVGLRYEF